MNFTRFFYVVAGCLAWVLIPLQNGNAAFFLDSQGHVVPVQIPYAKPPEPEFPDIPQAMPAPKELTQEQLDRAEALLPLLEGRQEYYAIGEFNHLGSPAVPVLVKALQMPSPRVRYNAIETLSLIKDPRAVPYLLITAQDVNEMTRIRAHATRVAVRLDPSQVVSALQSMTKDPEETIRRTVAVQARFVRQIEVLYLLTELLGDAERFVALEAMSSFWRLTRYLGQPHNWEASTQKERKQWAQEWRAWLDAHADKFREPGKPSTQNID